MKPQPPATQVVLAFARAGQAAPHAPQLVGSVVSVASHPSAATWLQSPRPAPHVKPQALPVQLPAVAPAGTVQTADVSPRPSAVHVWSVVADVHVAIPGVQTHVEHRPDVHDAPALQVTACVPSPSALQTELVVAEVHVPVPGVQVHATQTPAEQLCIDAQAVVA